MTCFSLTKVDVHERMLRVRHPIDGKLQLARLVALFVEFFSQGELMAFVVEIVPVLESFQQALGLHAHLRLASDVDSYQTTAHIVFNRHRSLYALQKRIEVYALYVSPKVLVNV